MEAEWVGLNVDETEYVLEEALKCYGSMADASQIRTLFAFYRRYLGMADVARRQALLTRITEFVSEGRQNRYLALRDEMAATPPPVHPFVNDGT